MRLLSIGRPLQHRLADNHTLFNAPALFDYDAIAIDPGGVFDQLREVTSASKEHATASGLALVNGASGADALGLAELLHRRRDEAIRALERGAVLIVFTYPQATLPTVAGFSGADRYFFLPAPAGIAWDATTVRWGEGRAGGVVQHDHPFAAAVDALREHLHYRAYFDERVPGFAEAATVFARSAGGAPIGVQFEVLGGQVVFLPTADTRGGEAAALGGAIMQAAEELLARGGTAEPPRWLAQQTVPGLEEREQAETHAQEALERAEEALAGARAEAESLRAVRDVLWRRGRYALQPAVVRCLRLLGFRNVSGDEGMRLRSDEGTLYVEAEAADGEVGMAPHYRLRARLDAWLEETGKAGRGLVVASGHVAQAPERRERQYIPALETGAEATRYALLTSTALFAAARFALAEPGADRLRAIRERLLTTDGLVTLDDLLGEG